jgi:hypothetical protein
MLSGEIFKSSSISAKTGLAPDIKIAFAGEIQLKGVVIISSFFFKFKAFFCIIYILFLSMFKPFKMISNKFLRFL